MGVHGLYNEQMAVAALPSAARVNGTANGLGVDLGVFGNNFREALFVIHAATITDGTAAFTLQESRDGATWTNVDAQHVQGGPVSLGAAQSNTVASLGYLGGGPARYVRLVATTTGATTGGVFSAVAVLADGSDLPINRA